MNKSKFQLIEKIILVVGLVTLALLIGAVMYSLGFLSTNLLHSLSGDNNIGGPAVDFNINGFNELGL